MDLYIYSLCWDSCLLSQGFTAWSTIAIYSIDNIIAQNKLRCQKLLTNEEECLPEVKKKTLKEITSQVFVVITLFFTQRLWINVASILKW